MAIKGRHAVWWAVRGPQLGDPSTPISGIRFELPMIARVNPLAETTLAPRVRFATPCVEGLLVDDDVDVDGLAGRLDRSERDRTRGDRVRDARDDRARGDRMRSDRMRSDRMGDQLRGDRVRSDHMRGDRSHDSHDSIESTESHDSHDSPHEAISIAVPPGGSSISSVRKGGGLSASRRAGMGVPHASGLAAVWWRTPGLPTMQVNEALVQEGCWRWRLPMGWRLQWRSPIGGSGSRLLLAGRGGSEPESVAVREFLPRRRVFRV